MRASPNAERPGSPRFGALAHRDFRIFWLGGTVSATGTWMQIVALNLLVLELTKGSPVALGGVSLAQGLSFLIFAPVGGGAADHFDKRRLLFVTQSLLMTIAGLLAVLQWSGALSFWMIPIAAFLSGTILSFDQPARNALVSTLVPKENLMNAVSLQSAVFNGAGTIGPALASWTLARFGFAGNFLLNALSYLAVIAALVMVRPPASAAPSRATSLWRSVREALVHVRRDAVLPSVLLSYGALLFLGPSMQFLLPIFVRETSTVGSERLGLLLSAVGLGTVVGALTVASLGDVRRKGWLLLGAVLTWASALAVFILQTNLAAAVAALTVLGMAQAAAGASTVTLLQTRVPPQMRGRAMSLNTLLIMCVRPLGDFPAGAAIAAFGLHWAVLGSAALVGAAALALLVTRPAVRQA
jgi:MFS family permease